MTINLIFRRYRPITSILFYFLVMQPHCYGQVKVTLQDAIDSTLNRNLQVKEAQLNALLSEESYKQSRYNRLPSLSASPQASFNWGRSLDVSTYNYENQRIFLFGGNLGTQVTLFQGGFIRKQIVQNKMLLESDETNISKIKFDLTLATLSAFLQILAGQDLLLKAQQQIFLAKLNVEKVKKSFNVGQKSNADLAQALAQQSNSELDEATIKNQLEISLFALKQLMEMPNAILEIVKPDINQISSKDYSASEILAKALDFNPEIRIATLRQNAAYQNISVYKSYLYPTLSLFGSIGSNFSDSRKLLIGQQQIGYDTIGRVANNNQPVVTPIYNSTFRNYPFLHQISGNFYQSVGISLQIPIFNKFSAVTNIKKATIIYHIAEANTQIVLNNFIKIIKQALSDIKTAEMRLNSTKINVSANKEIFDVSEKRYQAGLLNSIDYNLALNNFNKAEFDLIQAKYDLFFKYKVIDFYLGKSIAGN